MKTISTYPCKSKQLASRLGMTETKLRALVKVNTDTIGERNGHYWTPKQIKTIAELKLKLDNKKERE